MNLQAQNFQGGKHLPAFITDVAQSTFPKSLSVAKQCLFLGNYLEKGALENVAEATQTVLDRPYADQGLIVLHGYSLLFLNRLSESEELFREHALGTDWHLSAAYFYAMSALHRNDFSEFTMRLEELAKNALAKELGEHAYCDRKAIETKHTYILYREGQLIGYRIQGTA